MVKQMTKPLAKQRAHDVAYYYDTNLTEEDLMSESTPHAELVRYLVLVLKWHLREQPCSIYENLGFYRTRKSGEKPVAPDIALIKGMAFQAVRSWKIGKTGPGPAMTFEIISEETGDKDLYEKPAKYARMGVKEYFAYDPNTPPIKKGTTTRLYGWQLDEATGQMKSMPLDADGRLWSPLLESFLVPDGLYLRFYDREGHLRLTGEEAEAQAKQAETRRADAEAKAKRDEKRRADAEARRADAATRRADVEAKARLAETRRADAEAKAKEVLAEKLRSLGIDPNQL